MFNMVMKALNNEQSFLSFFKLIELKIKKQPISISPGFYYYFPKKVFTIYISKNGKNGFSLSPSEIYSNKLTSNKNGFFAVKFSSPFKFNEAIFNQKVYEELKKYEPFSIINVYGSLYYKGNILKLETFPEEGLSIFSYSGGNEELLGSNLKSLQIINKLLSQIEEGNKE